MSDWLSVIPPLLAIAVVLWKKEVILALLVAIFASEFLFLLSGTEQQALAGFALASGERIVNVFVSGGNARILVFSLLVGALLAFMRYSGGVTATVNYLVEKGSITINGVSLTISKILKDGFQTVIVPHTLKLTNLVYLKEKDIVNVEFDVLSKYIKKFLK